MDSLLLSARDMYDEENVKDAAFELERCHDAESYQRWCERWARALIAASGDNSLSVSADEQIRTAEGDATRAEEAHDGLKDVVQSAIDRWDNVATDEHGKMRDRIAVNDVNDIFGMLENSL